MFEKSLYDLIKGLRNHKGAEEEYIQNSLRECKAEIRSQDMDKKATALLKVIYLEMFGYDMSWASFHVLEVMSSTNHLQKRVGYLGAMQSFRSDTEVLMLATNLLKKDISSSNIPLMSLPMVTLPHIITPSLSMSLLPDSLSRISHSNAVVRKKAVVCLYRLALAYPEALKLAWPKIKERLMDDQEDGSVTTAVINVVCELGWRRPHDFLPLAPRLFELLVEGGNNWMAIKIIKLFATLTPLEPRLVRKLFRPLINVIQTTTAMSLLYECINGVVQGGILDGDGDYWEKDEIASLCVGKLRGMIVTDADPNLKYVALLAFNRIVVSHPALVSMQQDVILECLEDADVSIRLQALDLVSGMVTSETLEPVVNRLVKQLNNASSEDIMKDQSEGPVQTPQVQRLPPEYKLEVLHRILDICSGDNYAQLPDFEWYLNVLEQLVKHLPSEDIFGYDTYNANPAIDIACRVSSEIRNVAVRVRNVRPEATKTAESLILAHNKSLIVSRTADDSILSSLAWVVGEYAEYLSYPGPTLQSLIDASNISLPPKTLSIYLQAIPKVLVRLTSNGQPWDKFQKSETSLLLARIIEFFENLASHAGLDVQERASEFLEALRLATEAVNAENTSDHEMPFILSTVIPGLFVGLELNPVAASAQRKVPFPEKLDLDQPLNESSLNLFGDTADFSFGFDSQGLSRDFYFARDVPVLEKGFTDVIPVDAQMETSYQNPTEIFKDPASRMKRIMERRDRNKEDPFYVDSGENSSGTSTPFHKVFNASNGDGVDVDSIPIIDLKIDGDEVPGGNFPTSHEGQKKSGLRPKKYNVISDETIGFDESTDTNDHGTSGSKRSLLQVDTSGLGHLPLEEDAKNPDSLHSRGRENEGGVEMAKAMEEVERLRLEMQRATERIHTKDVPTEGMLVKKKKKKDRKSHVNDSERATLPEEGSKSTGKKKKKHDK